MFSGILNKIKPQTYGLLVEVVDLLVIDTEDRLKTVLDLVFDKSVDEPVFCLLYANMCKHISKFNIKKLNAETGIEEEVKFQRLLLSRCQKEFESDVYHDIDVAAKQKTIEECTETAEKIALVNEFEEEKLLARRKSLGVIT